MATVVYRDAYFWLNGKDYSSDVKSATLNYSSEMLDATAMGHDTRVKKGGLKNWSLDLEFHQNFAANKVGADLFALVGTTTCFELRPLNSCTTAINPSYTGVGVLDGAPPAGGGVGSLLETKSAIQSAGTLSRASSS
jgi:hypothetical protein